MTTLNRRKALDALASPKRVAYLALFGFHLSTVGRSLYRDDPLTDSDGKALIACELNEATITIFSALYESAQQVANPVCDEDFLTKLAFLSSTEFAQSAVAFASESAITQMGQ